MGKSDGDSVDASIEKCVGRDDQRMLSIVLIYPVATASRSVKICSFCLWLRWLLLSVFDRHLVT